MSIMKNILIIMILFSSTLLLAQEGRQNTPLYNLNGGNYLNKGWHLAPGITYLIPTPAKRSEFKTIENGADTLYQGDYHSKGKIGLYLEIGKHKFLDRRPLSYMDYGIGFKTFKGSESFNGFVSGNIPFSYNAEFKNSFITGFFNLSNVLQLTDKTFIQNSFGLNADYRIINKTPSIADYGSEISLPSAFLGQVHYKFGFGFKAGKNLYVVPTIETPILTIYQWNSGASTIKYFNTDYRPIIISLRFFWFKKRPVRDCVGAPDKKTGDQLWGKNMRTKGSKKRGRKKRRKK